MTQKFIIFKIAKNMGTTIHSILKMNENKINYIYILNEHEFDEKKIENAKIIFIAHETCIKKFKIKFNDFRDGNSCERLHNFLINYFQ